MYTLERESERAKERLKERKRRVGNREMRGCRRDMVDEQNKKEQPNLIIKTM